MGVTGREGQGHARARALGARRLQKDGTSTRWERFHAGSPAWNRQRVAAEASPTLQRRQRHTAVQQLSSQQAPLASHPFVLRALPLTPSPGRLSSWLQRPRGRADTCYQRGTGKRRAGRGWAGGGGRARGRERAVVGCAVPGSGAASCVASPGPDPVNGQSGADELVDGKMILQRLLGHHGPARACPRPRRCVAGLSGHEPPSGSRTSHAPAGGDRSPPPSFAPRQHPRAGPPPLSPTAAAAATAAAQPASTTSARPCQLAGTGGEVERGGTRLGGGREAVAWSGRERERQGGTATLAGARGRGFHDMAPWILSRPGPLRLNEARGQR